MKQFSVSLLAISLLYVSLAVAMDATLTKKEVKKEIIPDALVSRLSAECVFQASALEGVANLEQLFARVRLLDSLIREIGHFTPIDAKTSEKWQALAPHLKSLTVTSVQSHNLASAALSKVACFGSSAHQCHELMRQTKGSERVVAIARENLAKSHEELRTTFTQLRALEHTGASGLLAQMPYILELLHLKEKDVKTAIEQLKPLLDETIDHAKVNAKLMTTLTAQKEEAALWRDCMELAHKRVEGQKHELKTSRHVYVHALMVVFDSYHKTIHGADCDKAAIHKGVLDQISACTAKKIQALTESTGTLPARIMESKEKIEQLKGRIDTLLQPFKADQRAMIVIQAWQAAYVQSLQGSCVQPLVNIVESIDGIVAPLIGLFGHTDRTDIFLADATLEKYSSLLQHISIEGNKAKTAAHNLEL